MPEDTEASVAPVAEVMDKDKENNNEAAEDKAESSDSEDESTVTGTYIVEKILDKRMMDSEWKYLIKWQGWPSYTNTWEPKRNLVGCNERLKEFEEVWEGKHKRKRERAMLEEIEYLAKKEEECKLAKLAPEDLDQGAMVVRKETKKRKRRY